LREHERPRERPHHGPLLPEPAAVPRGRAAPERPGHDASILSGGRMGWDGSGKTILGTGATGGTGPGAPTPRARRRGPGLLRGRDPARTDAALAAARERSGSKDLSSLLCDFESQARVRALARAVLETRDALHVLVNNAGSVNAARRTTADGIEATFAVNHLGY